jgi:hypothetical protein
MQIQLSDVFEFIESQHASLQHDVNRSIRIRRTDEALLAVGGMDALTQLKNHLVSKYDLAAFNPQLQIHKGRRAR